MSEKALTPTECLVIIAYFGFLQSINGKRVNSSVGEGGKGEFGHSRQEKGSNSMERPNYTLEDLLAQVPKDHSNAEKATTASFGPPRKEAGSYPLKRPDYTLKDLLDQITEDNLHEDVDAGPPVGNEVW